jgi:hypothetical protein
VELLVVIAIIGLLVTMLLPAVQLAGSITPQLLHEQYFGSCRWPRSSMNANCKRSLQEVGTRPHDDIVPERTH